MNASDYIYSDTLCINCDRACGGCSWSKDFAPVEGWVAEPRRISRPFKSETDGTDTFLVKECPMFKLQTGDILKEDRPRELRNFTNAIVIKACDDYINIKSGCGYSGKGQNDNGFIEEILSFFHSDWYKVLTTIDPDFMISEMNKVVQKMKHIRYDILPAGKHRWKVIDNESGRIVDTDMTKDQANALAAVKQGIPVRWYMAAVRRDSRIKKNEAKKNAG